jgi:hypothetical protein
MLRCGSLKLYLTGIQNFALARDPFATSADINVTIKLLFNDVL